MTRTDTRSGKLTTALRISVTARFNKRKFGTVLSSLCREIARHTIRLPASARHKKTVAMLDSKTIIKVGRGGRDVTFILKIRCSAVAFSYFS